LTVSTHHRSGLLITDDNGHITQTIRFPQHNQARPFLAWQPTMTVTAANDSCRHESLSCALSVGRAGVAAGRKEVRWERHAGRGFSGVPLRVAVLDKYRS
jgi:hypothetical protein